MPPQHDGTLLAEVKHAARCGQVIVTKHAQERMQERKVSAEDVKHAIATAKSAVAQRKQGTIRLEGGTDIDGDELKVVLAKDPRGLRLVTVA